MKKLNKLTSIILSVIMLIAVLPIFDVAAADIVDSGECGIGLSWSLDSDGVLTVSGEGEMEFYDGMTGPWCDDYCDSIETVVIENGVTNINWCAFYECSSLVSVTIPDSITSIGDDAFSGCSSLANISIPDSVTSIGDSAFKGCSSLTSINIPDGITKIGWCTFYDCNSLTSITIPSSVTNIDDWAFCGCTGLTSVIIPDGVTSIGSCAFLSCDNLTNVTIPESVTYIGENAFITDSDLVIYGYTGSAAEAYAEEEWIEFISLGTAHTHTYTSKVTKAATCTEDGVKTFTCSCGDSYTETINATGHKIVNTPAVAPTCTNAGSTAGTKCSVCGTVTKAPATVKAKGHTYKTVTTKATLTSNGSTVTKCATCGYVKSTVTIAKIKSVSLSKTSFTYNGKAQKPTVTVKDSNGKTLKQGTDYSVKISSGRKNVGQYTVTVTFMGNYSGTKKLTYTIVPKGTSVSSLSAGKKQFTAKWSKQSTQTSGYEIQYSLKSNMKSAKSVTVKKNSTTSTTVKNLQSGKNYYVRIRTYKTVKINGKSTKLYSSWSSAKKIKTK